jgi:hypothetical protein
MKKKWRNKKCYYCGEKATTEEHAPPKQIFRPSGGKSFKVPSCKQHNTEKSSRDQAIIHGFLKSLLCWKDSLEPEIYKTLIEAMKGFNRTKRTAIIRTPIKNANEKIPKLCYLTKENEIHGWIRHLSAAVIYDALQRYEPSVSWDKLDVFSPDFIPSKDNKGLEVNQFIKNNNLRRSIEKEINQLGWIEGWSANRNCYKPKVYRFEIAKNKNILCHVFFNRFKWYIWLPKYDPLRVAIVGKLYGYYSLKTD